MTAARTSNNNTNGFTKHAPRRVLVVDDHVDTCELFQIALMNDGHLVEIAYDGQEGLDKLLGGDFDVALIDIALPTIDGYELARRARAATAHRSPPLRLIALTGYGRPRDRVLASDAGFDSHLLKPVDPLALSALIHAP
jgi:CheY-like chemotaxis protein